jgi:hypothetical protein
MSVGEGIPNEVREPLVYNQIGEGCYTVCLAQADYILTGSDVNTPEVIDSAIGRQADVPADPDMAMKWFMDQGPNRRIEFVDVVNYDAFCEGRMSYDELVEYVVGKRGVPLDQAKEELPMDWLEHMKATYADNKAAHQSYIDAGRLTFTESVPAECADRIHQAIKDGKVVMVHSPYDGEQYTHRMLVYKEVYFESTGELLAIYIPHEEGGSTFACRVNELDQWIDASLPYTIFEA